MTSKQSIARGAVHGQDAIPEAMRSAVLNCDAARGRPRPEAYSTRDAGPLADLLAR